MPRIAETGWKCLEMSGNSWNGLTWLEMAGNCWKGLNGWKQLKLLDMAENG